MTIAVPDGSKATTSDRATLRIAPITATGPRLPGGAIHPRRRHFPIVGGLLPLAIIGLHLRRIMDRVFAQEVHISRDIVPSLLAQDVMGSEGFARACAENRRQYAANAPGRLTTQGSHSSLVHSLHSAENRRRPCGIRHHCPGPNTFSCRTFTRDFSPLRPGRLKSRSMRVKSSFSSRV